MNERILTVSVDDRGILHSALIGSIPAERIEQLGRDIDAAKTVVKEEYQKRGLDFKSLIDLTRFEGTYVPKAIAMLAEYMKANKPFVSKSAAYGGGDTVSLAANIVATIAGRDNLAFFKSKEEAEAWLSK